jgi:FtsZ-binding cell division protein ZapB
MTWFLVFQLIFDIALITGVLFIFNMLWQKMQHRRDDDEVLRNVELQELKAGLQELLLTVRQVGADVSGKLHDKAQEAEATIGRIEELLEELRPELEDLRDLSREVAEEREHLEAKNRSLRSIRRATEPLPVDEPMKDEEEAGTPVDITEEELISSTAVGFSSTAVKEIYRLADTQMDVGEIARQTQLTRGEVQLILNLRSNRFTTPN